MSSDAIWLDGRQLFRFVGTMRTPYIGVGLLCALLLTSTRAPAQVTEPDSVEAIPIAPVVVTVMRTPVEIMRIPYAVSVNDAAEIQAGNPGLGLGEALRGIPGVQVDNRYNYALGDRIVVRGFGARAQFGVRGVKVIVDGIPATLPDGQTSLSHVDLGTLARAEVIRGPASVLYGNAAGGVIELRTQRPPTEPLVQELGVTAGSSGLLRLHSSTGGQSGSTSYLLHFSRLAHTGYRDFSSAEKLHLNARLGFEGETGDLHLVFSGVDYDANNPGSLSHSLLAADRTQAYGFNKVQQTGEAGRQGQLGATWRRELAAGEVEVSGYALMREIEHPIPPAIIALDRKVAGLRALFRTRSTGPYELRVLTGADGAQQYDDRRNFTNESGGRGALILDQRERVSNLGVFTQLLAAPTDRIMVMGGIRHDWFRFTAEDRLLGMGNADDSGSRRLDAVSPSIGITYSPSDPVNIYANLATSFETPTTTELANRPSGAGGFNPDLEPQRTVSFEVGAKGRVSSRALYQLAFYRADVQNSLIPFEVSSAPGRQFFRNAGSATHQGVEAALTFMPLPGSRIQATYTYTDARFDSYITEEDTFSGNRIPGAAPHRAEVILSHEASAGWFTSIAGKYVSELAVNDANTAYSPASFVTDLRAGISSVTFGGLQLEPFAGISNVFDVEYNSSVVVNAFGGRYFEPGPGRALYGGMAVRIGSDRQPSSD